MKSKLLTLALLATIMVAAADLSAQALWRRNGSTASMYTPKPAKLFEWRKGDTVLVRISENIRSSRDDKFESTKDANLEVNVDDYIKLGTGLNFLPGDGRSLAISADAKYETENEGKRGRRSTFSDTIMAEVTEILPGYDPEEGRGQMMIRAFKQITLSDDVETITLTGRIEVLDILRDRSIPANRVLDSRISYTGKGDVSDSAKQGWFSKILNTVWPF